MTINAFEPPYAIFLGDEADPGFAKTGYGLVEWRNELCVGQIRFPGSPIDLGLPELSLADLKGKANALIIGVAARGGDISPDWLDALKEVARAGIDIVAGTHVRLSSFPELVAVAKENGSRLIDVRSPPPNIPIGTGKKRSGLRLLTVGTDCVSGKKYTALALETAMRARGVNVDFRATGQTGIMIAGSGVPIDAVVCDFTAGAAEILSPDNDADHWDIIEGQGSLFHPSYAGVALSLLHGSQPDAIVLCHDASRHTILGLPDFPLPALEDAIVANLESGKLTNPAVKCIGVSVNTSKVAAAERKEVLDAYSTETGLPCVDPLIDGVDAIIENLMETFS